MPDFGAGLEGLQQHIFSHLVTPTTYMGENKDMRVLAVILLASSAYAQTLTLNLHTGNEPLGFSVQMEDISVEGLKLNFLNLHHLIIDDTWTGILAFRCLFHFV